MAPITIRDINNKEEWEAFVLSHPESNFLHSWHWGEFHQSLGKQIQRTGFFKNNELRGVMLSIVERAKRGVYLTVPGGPIIDWQDPELVTIFIEEVKQFTKSKGCVFARVRSQLEFSDWAKKIFSQNGFIDAPMHLHAELTSQLDISPPEEILLANMRKSTRYEIKKAVKLGIRVNFSNNPSLIRDFYDLQVRTAKRQKFIPFSYEFLANQFEIFSKDKLVLLFSASLNGELLAQAFVIFYGHEAVYHYGASTEKGRKYPGSYLCQWEAIKQAKQRGMRRYNFWGVAPLDKPGHRFYGVSVFKRGFGGRDIQYLHAQDLVINRPRYLADYAIESIRRRVRKV